MRGGFAAKIFVSQNNKMSVLAVVDGPVELCVTRLRYAQIHGASLRSIVHRTAATGDIFACLCESARPS
jgi:hypothetical protein